MRRLMLAILILAGSVAGLLSPPPAKAGNCVTYCTSPNPCGYVCCFQQCCNGRCVDLDCAPPPPCEGDN